MNTTVKVINSVTAIGADCTVTPNGLITIAGCQFKSSDVIDFSITPYLADTAQVHTSTTTATASTQYQIMISCVNRITLQWENFVSPIITSAASTSKTAINTYFYNWVNQVRNGGVGPMTVTATLVGGSPNDELVLTGDTYFPEFTVTNIGTGTITFADTTPGVVGSGDGAKILAVGQYLPSSADSVQITSTNHYTTVEIKVGNESFNGSGITVEPEQYVIYVNEDDTDYASLVGYDSTLAIGYGTLASVLYNNRKATYRTVGANVAVSSLVATRASGSFFNENIKSGDLFLIGTTPALITFPYWDGVTVADLIVNKALVSGSDVSSAAALLVKFTNLP